MAVPLPHFDMAKKTSSVPPRPRRTRRPLERPGELLVAALATFTEHGYETSNLDDVARAAGVTKGAIYSHFESKADLLRRAITHRLHENFEAIEAQLSERAAASPEEKLRGVMEYAWARWSSAEFARFLGLLAEVRRVVPDALQTWLHQGPLTGWAIVSRIIAEGQRSGDFDPDLDPDATGRLLASGVVFQALVSGGATGWRAGRARTASDAARVGEVACALVRRKGR